MTLRPRCTETHSDVCAQIHTHLIYTHSTLFNFINHCPLAKKLISCRPLGAFFMLLKSAREKKSMGKSFYFPQLDRLQKAWNMNSSACVCERRKVKGFGFLLPICFLAVFSVSLNTISLKVCIYQLFCLFFSPLYPKALEQESQSQAKSFIH